jgi:DNA-binding CsgD family transcriptional regulator
VALAVRGLRNRQIGERLSIAEHTVEWHLSRVYGKLEVQGRTGLLGRFFEAAFLPSF